MMITAPKDVLLVIFDAFTNPESFDWPNTIYEPNLAKAPFILSSVCRNWRSLGRDTSSLWTYFGFESNPKKVLLDAHLDRLRILQTLSKDRPLDIVYHAYEHLKQSDGVQYDYGVQIATALNDVAPRWRNVALRLPHFLTSRMDTAMRGHFPTLETLSIAFYHSKVVLPSAPRLQRLYLVCAAPVMGHDDTIITRLPSLISLGAYLNGSMLRSLVPTGTSSTLRELCILETINESSKSSWLFPCLKSLTLNDAHFLRVIEAPNIEALTVNCGHILSVQHSVVSRFARTVQHLTIYSHVEPPLVHVLAMFSSIKSLSIDIPRLWSGPYPTLTSESNRSCSPSGLRWYRQCGPCLRGSGSTRPTISVDLECYYLNNGVPIPE
ncbi:hypothetical protein BKA62DRAFT_233814 [Auriculariales sp. MPI-PUGE-AT-0066]|nr:hypothetical protein BKA62DRAFT_233814 [Auriculariales sp. MPI-PUGE-AT-0066]